MPFGLSRQRSRSRVANPRRAISTASVCALHRLHRRGNAPYEKIVNRLLWLVAAIAVAYTFFHFTQPGPHAVPAAEVQAVPAASHAAANRRIAQAFSQREHAVAIQSAGVVSKVLPDDNDGSRHQRFILELDNGMTVLVAHNIDLAPRLDGLRAGDAVEFNGVYEWNAKGGVVHWTHHDPRGQHADGWLRYQGRLYQ
ncbi:DUF3465 domain-containing protein [Methylobacillus flagellatus]|nr:DUF3465 domain-containing protein [Methylobacillus flagellatus]